MRCQHHDLDAFGQQELGADHQVNAAFFRFHMCLYDARERTLVGYRDASIAEFGGLRDQFIRVRSAIQEAEVALAVQFGESVRRSNHG